MCLLVCFLFLCTGCGMSQKTLDRGKAVPASISEATEVVTEREASLARLTSGDGEWLAKYSEREKWKDKFTAAHAEVNRVNRVYEQKLKLMLETNSGSNEATATTLIEEIETGLAKAKDESRFPTTRAGQLETARANAPQMASSALNSLTSIVQVTEPLLALVQATVSKFPDREADIHQRAALAVKLRTDAMIARDVVRRELATHTAKGDADYAALVDSAVLLGQILPQVGTENTRVRVALGELNTSFSRTLLDMKQRFFIQVSRSSWDESSDWDTETVYAYPWVEVNEQTFETVDNLPDEDNLATYGFSFFGSGFSKA